MKRKRYYERVSWITSGSLRKTMKTKMARSSPSNITTGWWQKFFNRVEPDTMLDRFIEIFVKNGNEWFMEKKTFDKIVSEKELFRDPVFKRVYEITFDVEGDLLCFDEMVIQHLLKHRWCWSPRNTWKNLKRAMANKK